MNDDDDDRTIVQTDEDREILQKKVLQELADKTPEVETPERDRQETRSRISH